MKKMNLPFLVLLCAFLACNGPKNLETKINNRPTISMTAEAKKVDGQWTVEMILPVGTWKVKTDENQVFEIIQGNPRSTLRWRVSRERWGNADRPFHFQLDPQVGSPINMSVKYPYAINTVSSILLTLVASGSPRS